MGVRPVWYQSLATGTELAPAIATADACTMRGAGTIAPVNAPQ